MRIGEPPRGRSEPRAARGRLAAGVASTVAAVGAPALLRLPSLPSTSEIRGLPRPRSCGNVVPSGLLRDLERQGASRRRAPRARPRTEPQRQADPARRRAGRRARGRPPRRPPGADPVASSVVRRRCRDSSTSAKITSESTVISRLSPARMSYRASRSSSLTMIPLCTPGPPAVAHRVVVGGERWVALRVVADVHQQPASRQGDDDRVEELAGARLLLVAPRARSPRGARSRPIGAPLGNPREQCLGSKRPAHARAGSEAVARDAAHVRFGLIVAACRPLERTVSRTFVRKVYGSLGPVNPRLWARIVPHEKCLMRGTRPADSCLRGDECSRAALRRAERSASRKRRAPSAVSGPAQALRPRDRRRAPAHPRWRSASSHDWKDEGDEGARRKLIESNLRLVMSITRNYTRADVAAARPDPGGQPRPHARRRQVRLDDGLQALDVRDLVDPAGRSSGRWRSRAGRSACPSTSPTRCAACSARDGHSARS